MLLGVVMFIDALDSALYFPITPFALLLLLEGLCTLAVAWTGMGGQRTLRYVKGFAFCFAAALILAGHHHGNFILSMIFGTLFLVDGSAADRLRESGPLSHVAPRDDRRRRRNRDGDFLLSAVSDHYVGTVPYCVGLGLMFGGWNMILLSTRVRRMAANPGGGVGRCERGRAPAPPRACRPRRARRVSRPVALEWDGPPAADEAALTVHVWTPVGSAKGEARRQLIVDRYIAAVDRNGVISTGHAALESPEGIYISLYPAVEIDRSPDDFSRLLRATRENDVPGVFQPDYATESKAWCPSTLQVRIRNYDPRAAAPLLGRVSARHDLQPHASQLFEHRVARAGGGDRRRVGARVGQRRRLEAVSAHDHDAGIVGRRATAQTRRDDGVDARPHARLCARAQHARRPASVGLGEDGARSRCAG